MNLEKSIEFWKKRGECALAANRFVEPVIEKGEGSYIWDIDGNKYLDFNSGQFCLCFGHNYSPFIECMNEQMKKIVHTNTNTMTEIVFRSLERLVEINDNKFSSGILLSTGAEANEFAFRFTKSIKKNNNMIYLNQGYHGQTLGSQSVSSFGRWAFPTVQGTYGVTAPNRYSREETASIENIKKILEEHKSGIAAMVMEPILGAGGMIYPPGKFYKNVRQLCDEYGVILIFDECQTGFGRTGEWFCYENYGIEPDILVFGKASGAGFPVSGVLFNKELTEEVKKGNLTHFSSHQNDPLAAAAILFVIDEIINKNILEKITQNGKDILDRIIELSSNSKVIVKPRGMGLMIAFDINEELFQDNFNPGIKLVELMQAKGVLIQCINRGRTFRIMPNYLIAEDEIDFFLRCLEESIHEI